MHVTYWGDLGAGNSLVMRHDALLSCVIIVSCGQQLVSQLVVDTGQSSQWSYFLGIDMQLYCKHSPFLFFIPLDVSL